MSITENFDLELEFCCNKSYIPFDNSVFVIVHDLIRKETHDFSRGRNCVSIKFFN